ncbi:hypothetical protein Q7489_02190 [Glaesserella parasuis]|nr:hypothetical protein [Glaesserella parasuis]
MNTADLESYLSTGFYALKIFTVIIVYLCFVRMTIIRENRLKKKQNRVPIKLFEIHIDLYAFFVPIFIVLMIVMS